MLDTNFIHNALGLPVPEKKEIYNFFRVARRVKENDFAFLFSSNTDLNQEELADLAIEKGATLLCSTEQIKDYPCLVVDDLQEAWIQLSSAYRKCYDVRVVGITGSIGKTTTKEIIVATLGSSVRSNQGNLNLYGYVGNVVQGLREKHKYYVQEISESPVKNAAAISKMIHPDVSVITKIAESHMEKFGTIENVVENCFSITAGMDDHGVVIINADDTYQIDYEIKFNKITYGIRNSASHYRAINVRPIYNVENLGIDFDVVYEDQIVPLHINFLGEHNVYCALAAFITAKTLGLSDAEIQKNILKAKPKGIRQNLVNIGNYSLYIDCYNANEASTRASLKTLSLLKNEALKFKRIAVLGDISQSNPDVVRIQQNIGKAVIDSKVDILITCGSLAKSIADIVKRKSSIKVFSTDNVNDTSDILQKILKPDDIILFKSSNSANLGLVADIVFGTNFYENSQRIFNKETTTVNNYTAIIYPRANHAKIIKYLGKESIIKLPNVIDDLPVWYVGKKLFANNKNIKKVEIPHGILQIQSQAFYKCINLKSVKLPTTLKSIATNSFSRCKSLKSLVIPDNVITIGSGAFAYCINLRRINFSTKLQILGDKAFYQCSNLRKVIFTKEHHLKKIPPKAFADCENLREAWISPNISVIADDAFENCPKLMIIGKKHSYAQIYAQLHRIKFFTNSQYKALQLKRKIKRNLKKLKLIKLGVFV